jgi:hypothetical protein
LVSAAPAEIVEPLAWHLGAHGAVASVATVGPDGRYTGELERYAYGEEKASLIRRLADTDGLDLAGSFAYTDSATDVPMLEAVGHPVAVNPDRALRRIACLRGWDVRQFHGVRQPTEVAPRPNDTAPMPSGRSGSWTRRGSAIAAVVATAGGAGALAWRVRSHPGLGGAKSPGLLG